MRVDLGPLSSFAGDVCTPVVDGTVVVVRVGDGLCAFRNRCLHQDSPLAGGWVRDGVLSCPAHFWRYHVHDGSHIGGSGVLDRFDVEIVDGCAVLTLPDAAPTRSLRDRLLARASTYDRELAWRERLGSPSPTPPPTTGAR